MTHPTRPPLLNPLFAPARSLKGVGPRVEALLNRLFGIAAPAAARVIDLLFHLPVGVIDRKLIASIAEGRIGELVTLEVTVVEHRPGGPRRGARAPYRVLVEDEASALELVYFNADPAYLKRLLPQGSRRIISGRLEAYDGLLQMPHPDHVMDAEKGSLPTIEPVYPLTAGLSNSMLRKIVAQALDRLPEMPEWIDKDWLAHQQWPGFTPALRRLHAPEAEADLGPSASRKRLAYDELFANQLALAAIRQRMRKSAGRRIAPPANCARPFSAPFPSSSRARKLARLPKSTPISPVPIECYVCCKAMSAAARPWSRCSRWRARSRPAHRPH